jgi:hypothetical protein
MAEDICPRCALREITNEATGWCGPCAGEDATERYLAREREAVELRRRRWKQQQPSETREALRERQRKHRLYAAVQPRERPDAGTDPWELAAEGLRHLAKLNASVRGDRGRTHLAAAEECLRQLAVGPED